ncbi:hypothetical protein HDU67_004413 [Dinochytrium kinnereticum]|nr:hypothetical protein HDU67_004413 [Dinochytrium kinnereticum]
MGAAAGGGAATPTSPGGNTGAVDYLSFAFNEFDLHQCWRNATRQKDSIINGRSDKVFNPPNRRQKDSDVCWLYGPFHTYDPLPVLQAAYQAGNVANCTGNPECSSSTTTTSARNSVSLKPALKKHRTRHVPDDFLKNLRELYLRSQRSSSDPDLLSASASGAGPSPSLLLAGPLAAAVVAGSGGNVVALGQSMSVGSGLHSHRKADFFLANAERDQTMYRNDDLLDTDLQSAASSSRRSESPTSTKHLRFAEEVEQRLIVEPPAVGGVEAVPQVVTVAVERARGAMFGGLGDDSEESDEEGEGSGLRIASTSSSLMGATATVPLPPAHLKPEGPDTTSSLSSYSSTTSHYPSSPHAGATALYSSASTPSSSSGDLQRSGSGLHRSGSGSSLSSFMSGGGSSHPPSHSSYTLPPASGGGGGGLKRTTSGSGIASAIASALFSSSTTSTSTNPSATPNPQTTFAPAASHRSPPPTSSEPPEPSHTNLLTDDDLDDPSEGLFMLGSATTTTTQQPVLPRTSGRPSPQRRAFRTSSAVPVVPPDEEATGVMPVRSASVPTLRGVVGLETSVGAVGTMVGGDGRSDDGVEYGIVDRVSDLVSNAVDIVRWAKGQIVASGSG